MRYRFTFLLSCRAVGFIVGARAGRERYEQLKQLARKAADSPAMQQAAGAAQAQAAGLGEVGQGQGDGAGPPADREGQEHGRTAR